VIKRLKVDTDLPPVPTAEVKAKWSHNSYPLLSVHDVEKENLTLAINQGRKIVSTFACCI
jgi:hypothetical protein